MQLEGGKLPIQFVVSIRRQMFHWEILRRDPDELVHQVYRAQRECPSKSGDWYQMITQERQKYKIELSEEKISKMSKNSFRHHVREKISKFAFSYLISQGKQHSKSRDLVCNLKNVVLKTQPYLLTNILTTSQKQLLMSLRCKSYDTKANFKNKYDKEMRCRTCLIPDSYKNETHF